MRCASGCATNAASASPVTKNDLVRILKARKMTRVELAQIVSEWKD